MTLCIKKLHPDADWQVTKGNAGMDVCTVSDVVIYPGSSVLVPTGIAIDPAKLVSNASRNSLGLSVAVVVKARSGLSVKHNIEVGAGLIDESYRGEIMVHLYNQGNHKVSFKKGDRFAQLMFVPVYDIFNNIKIVEELELTDRGQAGFGSSGLKSSGLSIMEFLPPVDLTNLSGSKQ